MKSVGCSMNAISKVEVSDLFKDYNYFLSLTIERHLIASKHTDSNISTEAQRA
jgi:hypothetical protein